MTTNTNLIERLREISKGDEKTIAAQAADAIEALEAEVKLQSNRVVAVGGVAINSVSQEDYKGAVLAIKEVNNLNIALKKQIEALQADAERIEHLVKHASSLSADKAGNRIWCFNPGYGWARAGTFRAAIDAAMQKDKL